MEIYNKIRNKSETIDSFISKLELFNKNKPLIINNKLIIGVFIRIYKKVKDGKICYVCKYYNKSFILLYYITKYFYLFIYYYYFSIF